MPAPKGNSFGSCPENTGRPPIPKEEIEASKALYLELLGEGKNEAEISAVSGMPSWFTRWKWQEDEEFYTKRQRAQAHGAARLLADAQCKLQNTYERALDEAASPQLVAITDKIAQHARWMAARLAKDDYGDKQDITTNGKEIKGGVIVVASQADKDLLESV